MEDLGFISVWSDCLAKEVSDWKTVQVPGAEKRGVRPLLGSRSNYLKKEMPGSQDCCEVPFGHPLCDDVPVWRKSVPGSFIILW